MDLEEITQAYFETIKCFDEEVFNLNYHQARISKTIGLNINLHEYIFPPNTELLRCKVIYDESGILSVDFYPYEKREIKSFKLVYDDNVEYSKKKVDRKCLDDLYAKKDKADEIIIIKDSFVTDTSIANIAIEFEGIWITPKKPLLIGTTRTRLLEDNILKEKDITVDMLKDTKKIALMNAMIDFDVKDEFILI